MHLATTVSSVWIPLAACLTPANVSDNKMAPLLIEELPQEARFVLGDGHYDAKNVREAGAKEGWFLVTSKRDAYPHADDSVEVRRIFHMLRRVASENVSEHFKAIFEVRRAVPQRAKPTPPNSPWVQCWSISWRYYIAMNKDSSFTAATAPRRSSYERRYQKYLMERDST